MTTTMDTMTVLSLAEMIRSGEVTVSAADTDLSVEALADPSGPDCYPSTTIEFTRDGIIIASVGCWMLGVYMHGPNRRDNGQYIGDGWQWQTDDGDGATTGIPCRYISRDGMSVTWSADGMADLTLPTGCDDDDHEQTGLTDALEIIDDAIRDAYDDIGLSPAADDDVYAAMISDRSDRDIEVEIGDETVTVGLYAAIDAGRTVYTHDGAESVWEDADDCVAAARRHLRGLCLTAASSLAGDDDELSASLESVLTDDCV
jgi:hypothetical protein